jgi:hypothetical protein
VHGEVDAPGRRLAERRGHRAALVGLEQDPLARRAEREDAVDAAVDEVVDVRCDRVEVDRGAAVA